MESSGTPASPMEASFTSESTRALDNINPANLESEADELPSAETLRKAESYEIFDREGKAHPFKSLYNGKDCTARVLIIFVRHFFCGSCKEFLRRFCDTITPANLAPINTSVVIVGCGDPGLIDVYATDTGCQFPIFSDPEHRLYDELGMVSSLAMGPRPQYIQKSMGRIIAESVMATLKQVSSGLAMKGGNSDQNGGELLFELSGDDRGKQVVWCHRMQNTRDHTEVPELTRILKVNQS